MTELRPVWAEVDLAALRFNVAELCRIVAPARVLAVVKADGYGHGAVATGRAAVEAGAAMLGVALVEEGVELREAGIDAPILVLSEPVAAAATTVVAAGLTPAVYTAAGIEALAKAVVERDAAPLPVHLKVDTGMHRVGAAPEAAHALADLVDAHRELRLEGLWTHLAVADEPDNLYTAEQLRQFEAVRAELAEHGHRPDILHAANTAGALAFPGARYDLVRPGIGIYGIPPVPELASRGAVAAGAVGEGAGLLREATARGRRGVVRIAIPRRPARRTSPPCRSGTATACPATCRKPAAPCSCAGGAARSRAPSPWTS